MDLKPGNVYQVKTGLRSFLMRGVDVDLSYETGVESRAKDLLTGAATKVTRAGVTSQIHLYF